MSAGGGVGGASADEGADGDSEGLVGRRWWERQTGAEFGAGGDEVSLEARGGQEVADSNVGYAAAGFEVGGVVSFADDSVVRVGVCAGEDFGAFFGDELDESEGQEIAVESVSTGVSVLLVRVTDWVKRGVEIVGTGAGEVSFERGVQDADVVANVSG